MTVTIAVIPPEGDIATRDVPQDQLLSTAQGIVGGWIEGLTLARAGVYAFIREFDGLSEKDAAPQNRRATEAFRHDLFPGDYIAGTVIIVGPPDDEANTSSADLATVDRLFGTHLAR